MKLVAFVSDYKMTVDTLDRLKPEKLGIILCQNGVYHATTKENGKASSLLNYSANYYVIQEDLETRGLSGANVVDGKVKVVNFGDVVDLIFNEYDKTAWL
ncbi:MAG: DsrH/TusB family sulfur metabolism protein [Nitrospirota bacterium]